MRLLNWFLHLLVVALLCAGLNLHAQTQGNAPFAVDAYASAVQMNGGVGACTNAGCVNLREGVSTDDLIVCGASQEGASSPTTGCNGGSPAVVGNNPPWTFTDTLSSTWHMQTSASVGVNYTEMQIGYACAASTNATDRVNWTGFGSSCSNSFQCTRIKNACHSGAITVDGSVQTSVSAIAAGVTSTNTSHTTTATSDLIVAVAVHTNGTGGGVTTGVNNTPGLGITVFDPGMGQSSAWEMAPTFGSNSIAMAGFNGSGTQQIVMQSLAFKLPISLGDSVLPQAAIGTAYSAQLHCIGSAVSNPTYTLASGALPTGLTLHGATGVIDGTPSGSPGTVTPGFTCTDGTLTSSTDTMPLQVGAAFNAMFIAGSSSGNLNFVPAQFSMSANCGDMISIRTLADDTHFGQGYLQPINGAFGFVSDSAGSPVQAFLLNGGTSQAPMVEWVLGPVPTSGTDVITATNGTSSSSGILYYAEDIRGAQAVIDSNASQTIAGTTSGSTIASSYTTVVPNQLVHVATQTIGSSATVAYASPFSLDLTQGGTGTLAVGHALVGSPASITATSTITEPITGCAAGGAFDFCDNWSTLVTAFRPALPIASCPATNGTGEKKRRSMN